MNLISLFSNLKTLITSRSWLSFSIYLIVGFVTSILLGQSFYKVFANSTIDLDEFDPDIYPAIDVIHNPPLIVGFDEKVNLEFTFICGYVLKTSSCCQTDTTLLIAYGEEDHFVPTSLIKRRSGWLASSICQSTNE